MERWIGYNVSITCGSPLGVYQGSIVTADGTFITLTRAFRNGFPYPEPWLTINAADIKELKIIEPKKEDEKTHSTIAFSKPTKKAHRSTVSENLQSYNSSVPTTAGIKSQPGTSQSSFTAYSKNASTQPSHSARSKPIDIQGRPTNTNCGSGSGGQPGTTPNKGKQQRRRNEAFLGTPSDDPAMLQEFDFEKNLALFDKRAIWEELNLSQKPDLLRQTDLVAPKFRHDENVLSSSPAVYRAIDVPEEKRGNVEYVTDEGVVVPSVTAELRRDLWSSLETLGLHHNIPTFLARAAADIALRLLGGGRRLDPKNAHQVPTVVVLVGAHKEGRAGVVCARVLASHGVRTVLHVSGRAPHVALLAHLAQYRLTGHRVAAAASELPTADLIVTALASHSRDGVLYREAAEWTTRSRATVLSLDPPAAGTLGVVSKVSVLAVLPLAHSTENGKLYLANMAVPNQLFVEHGIKYNSPFGAKNVVALHLSDA